MHPSHAVGRRESSGRSACTSYKPPPRHPGPAGASPGRGGPGRTRCDGLAWRGCVRLPGLTQSTPGGPPPPPGGRARWLVASNVLDAATRLFEVGGASATLRTRGLDRHWRNARVLASHNPLIYRARLLGDRAVNGTPLERHYRLGG